MIQADSKTQAFFPHFENYQAMVQSIVYDSLYLPLDIAAETIKLKALLEMSYFRFSIFETAQLQAVMLFEKALRIKLYNEYKTITKIKLSVLLDKTLQLQLLDHDTIAKLRILKDLRNKSVHHATDAFHAPEVIANIKMLVEAIHILFPTQDMYFIVCFNQETQIEIKKLRYAYQLEEAKLYIQKHAEALALSCEPYTFKIMMLSKQGQYKVLPQA
jgi:hypothetical protein